jgi:hypothetical protein
LQKEVVVLFTSMTPERAVKGNQAKLEQLLFGKPKGVRVAPTQGHEAHSRACRQTFVGPET